MSAVDLRPFQAVNDWTALDRHPTTRVWNFGIRDHTPGLDRKVDGNHISVLPHAIERDVPHQIRNTAHHLAVDRDGHGLLRRVRVRVEMSGDRTVTRPPGNSQSDSTLYVAIGGYGDARGATPGHVAVDRQREIFAANL